MKLDKECSTVGPKLSELGEKARTSSVPNPNISGGNGGLCKKGVDKVGGEKVRDDQGKAVGYPLESAFQGKETKTVRVRQ